MAIVEIDRLFTRPLPSHLKLSLVVDEVVETQLVGGEEPLGNTSYSVGLEESASACAPFKCGRGQHQRAPNNAWNAWPSGITYS